MPPDAAAVTATTATATETTTAASQPWYTGKITTPEDIGWLQNKGWHDKPANDVALEAIKSYRDLEKLRGIPADQIVKWPKDLGDAEGWQTIRNKLGVPKEAKEYDFSDVKFPDGSPLDDGFAEMLKLSAHKNHLTKDAASAVAREMVNYMHQAEQNDKSEKDTYYAAENQKLEKSWGPNLEANRFVSENAAKSVFKATGMDDNQIRNTLSSLETAMGKANVMQMFLTIGQKIGEDRFVTSETGRNAGGVMTVEQAHARLNDLKKDKAWGAKWLSGDADARREFDALTRIITPTEK